jgi:hypothetical protein
MFIKIKLMIIIIILILLFLFLQKNNTNIEPFSQFWPWPKLVWQKPLYPSIPNKYLNYNYDTRFGFYPYYGYKYSYKPFVPYGANPCKKKICIGEKYYPRYGMVKWENTSYFNRALPRESNMFPSNKYVSGHGYGYPYYGIYGGGSLCTSSCS